MFQKLLATVLLFKTSSGQADCLDFVQTPLLFQPVFVYEGDTVNLDISYVYKSECWRANSNSAGFQTELWFANSITSFNFFCAELEAVGFRNSATSPAWTTPTAWSVIFNNIFQHTQVTAQYSSDIVTATAFQYSVLTCWTHIDLMYIDSSNNPTWRSRVDIPFRFVRKCSGFRIAQSENYQIDLQLEIGKGDSNFDLKPQLLAMLVPYDHVVYWGYNPTYRIADPEVDCQDNLNIFEVSSGTVWSSTTCGVDWFTLNGSILTIKDNCWDVTYPVYLYLQAKTSEPIDPFIAYFYVKVTFVSCANEQTVPYTPANSEYTIYVGGPGIEIDITTLLENTASDCSWIFTSVTFQDRLGAQNTMALAGNVFTIESDNIDQVGLSPFTVTFEINVFGETIPTKTFVVTVWVEEDCDNVEELQFDGCSDIADVAPKVGFKDVDLMKVYGYGKAQNGSLIKTCSATCFTDQCSATNEIQYELFYGAPAVSNDPVPEFPETPPLIQVRTASHQIAIASTLSSVDAPEYLTQYILRASMNTASSTLVEECAFNVKACVKCCSTGFNDYAPQRRGTLATLKAYEQTTILTTSSVQTVYTGDCVFDLSIVLVEFNTQLEANLSTAFTAKVWTQVINNTPVLSPNGANFEITTLPQPAGNEMAGNYVFYLFTKIVIAEIDATNSPPEPLEFRLTIKLECINVPFVKPNNPMIDANGNLARYVIGSPTQQNFVFTTDLQTNNGCIYMPSMRINGFSTADANILPDYILFKPTTNAPYPALTSITLAVFDLNTSHSNLYVEDIESTYTVTIFFTETTTNEQFYFYTGQIVIGHHCSLVTMNEISQTDMEAEWTRQERSYAVGETQKTLAITKLRFTPPSSFSNCGDPVYSYLNYDTGIFTPSVNANQIDPPLLKIYTSDSTKAAATSPFEKTYKVSLTMTMGGKYPVTWIGPNPAVPGVEPYFEFYIRDPCQSISSVVSQTTQFVPNYQYAFWDAQNVLYPKFSYYIRDYVDLGTSLALASKPVPFNCGSLSYAIVPFKDNQLSTIFKQNIESPSQMTVYFDDNAYVGSYEIQIVYSFTRKGATAPSWFQTKTYDFNLYPCKVKSLIYSKEFARQYTIILNSEAPLELKVGNFDISPACPYQVHFVINYADLVLRESFSNDLDFQLANNKTAFATSSDFTFLTFRLDRMPYKIWLQSFDPASAKLHTMAVFGYVKDPDSNVIYNSSNYFTVNVVASDIEINNSPPFYSPPLLDFKTTPGQKFDIDCGIPSDVEGDRVFVRTISLKPNPSWVHVVNETNRIVFQVKKVPTSAAGNNIEVTIELWDINNSPTSSLQTFFLHVYGNQKDLDNSEIGQLYGSKIEEALKVISQLPNPEILSDPVMKSTLFGEITINFSEIMFVNKTQELPNEPPKTWNSETGNFTDSFNVSIVFTEGRINQFSDTTVEEPITRDDFDFTWNVTAMDPKSLTLTLNFKYPQLVSRGFVDKVKITVKPDLFIGLRSGKPLVLNYTLTFELDKLVGNPKLYAQIEQTSYSFKQFMNSLMAGNFAVQILLSGSFAYLWGLINVLQLIVYCILFQVNTPDNAFLVSKALISMSSFDMFNTSNLYEKIFNFEVQEQDDEIFENAGMDTSNFIINMGFNGLIFCGLVIFVFLRALWVRLCTNSSTTCRRLNKLIAKQEGINGLMRFGLEGYLDIGLAALMQTKKLSWFNSSDQFASLLGLLYLPILVALPVYTFIIARRKLQAEQKGESLYLLNDFFDDLRFRNLPIQFHTVFLLVRLNFAILIMAVDHAYFQCSGHMFQVVALLIYNGLVKPQIDPTSFFIEMTNLFFVLISISHTFCYAVTTDDSHETIGWSQISFILMAIGFNTFQMIKITFGNCKKRMAQKKRPRRDFVIPEPRLPPFYLRENIEGYEDRFVALPEPLMPEVNWGELRANFNRRLALAQPTVIDEPDQNQLLVAHDLLPVKPLGLKRKKGKGKRSKSVENRFKQQPEEFNREGEEERIKLANKMAQMNLPQWLIELNEEAEFLDQNRHMFGNVNDTRPSRQPPKRGKKRNKSQHTRNTYLQEYDGVPGTFVPRIDKQNLFYEKLKSPIKQNLKKKAKKAKKSKKKQPAWQIQESNQEIDQEIVLNSELEDWQIEVNRELAQIDHHYMEIKISSSNQRKTAQQGKKNRGKSKKPRQNEFALTRDTYLLPMPYVTTSYLRADDPRIIPAFISNVISDQAAEIEQTQQDHEQKEEEKRLREGNLAHQPSYVPEKRSRSILREAGELSFRTFETEENQEERKQINYTRYQFL